MKAWPIPEVPRLPRHPGYAVMVHDSATHKLQVSAPNADASLYACGITPYDATHIGHANTYVAFDLLYRTWLDAGKSVRFAQNITDVDDPLLERAAATGVDWRELAAEQTELFRTDMAALRVLPPQHWITVTEAMPQIIDAVSGLVERGVSYFDPNDDVYQDDSHDVYYDISADPKFGTVSDLPVPEMMDRFVGHGGDPLRLGKRNMLDPILWRAHRPGEPEWDGGLIGQGRPGWHIGCAVIARQALGKVFDVTGGGRDLLFPHHEMSKSLARTLCGPQAGAQRFMHCGLISYQGEKMSKSLGNLVLVSQLRRSGVDPMAIRLTLLSHHYRSDWEWTDEQLAATAAKLETWRAALASSVPSQSEPDSSTSRSVQDSRAAQQGTDSQDSQPDRLADGETPGTKTVNKMRSVLALDLNAPAAIQAVDEYVALTNRSAADNQLVKTALDALLGLNL